MDTKDFVEHFKSTLNTSLKLWENSILTGSLSKEIPYERAVGIIAAFREVILKVDSIYTNFQKKISSEGDSFNG